ncbi:RAMP superfamily CRISPR-associated protein [Caldicoprobacter faecalis]|uniref:CRISPR-associated protein Cmr2 n=1 Tax=Caldicoprobacter faecalis TaxID=937334 RepID=A0A1I5WHW6_9FIRM|nr:RAMP superfamily CRISPR-associated protein [Caldicoprobacter faecalis]SFQ19255.1 CRISPR-associated protein Cmr2 [Caldicoprobacter faecalis]
MHKYDALLSINPEKVESLGEYLSFCKYYFKPKTYEKFGDYLQKRGDRVVGLKDEAVRDFGFLKNEERNQQIEKYKKYKSEETTKDFPLNWLKNEILKKNNKEFEIKDDFQLVSSNRISGIFDSCEQAYSYVKNLLPYSFIVYAKFELKQPYFSKDDDEFSIIQNPVLKEWAFKVPMVRGSSWKGALASVFIDLPDEMQGGRQRTESYFRIFGAGSECIKILESSFESRLRPDMDVEKLKEELVGMLLFELGIRLDKADIESIKDARTTDEVTGIVKKIFSQEDKAVEKSKIPATLKTRRGRAVFYPTYFNRLTLEVINPHNRRKRAGTQPIHFEVVPAGTHGVLQIVYIPYDAVLLKENALKNEVKRDLRFLLLAVEELSQRGIGAKTKLGWGTFELQEKHCCINGKLELDGNFDVKGWSICQG